MKREAKVFDLIFESMENEDIKEFAVQLTDTIPDYFYTVGASSTGKYHPQYALGNGGLARHTVALCRILNHIFSIDCFKSQFTSRERDLMRVAGIMHDTRKSGTQDDYENSKYTKFDHPLQAAEVVRKYGKGIPQEEINLVARIIEAHMGQWNVDRKSNTVLPTPKGKYQMIVHLADYLASRKDIDISFDPEFMQSTKPANRSASANRFSDKGGIMNRMGM